MESAQKTQERQEKTHIELLRDAYEHECTCNADGEWHYCALQLLANNNISVDNFANCVKRAVDERQWKVMLMGQVNCGKNILAIH